jgi:hypothetical protein
MLKDTNLLFVLRSLPAIVKHMWFGGVVNNVKVDV